MKKEKMAVLFFIVIALTASILYGGKIHDAARSGNLAEVEQLLKKNPKLVDARDGSQSTPIIIAGYFGHKNIVALLVKSGADVNAASEWGSSALSSAAQRGHTDIVRLLLANNVDFNRKNKYGDTAIDLADAWDHTEIVELLQKKGAAVHPLNNHAVKKLTGNIYRMTNDYSLRTNVVCFTGKDGFLTIDTGLRRTAKKLKQALETINGGQLDNFKFLINTHHHGDHTQANFIADQNVTTVNAGNLDDLVERGILKNGNGPLKGKTGKVFDKYYVLTFNGEEIRLIPYSGCHSQNDVMIHFTRSNVVHMGDLLLSQSFPAVSRNVPRYIDFLDRAMDIFPSGTTFVSGHGTEIDFPGLKRYRDMLADTIDIVMTQMRKGKTLDQMKQKNILGKYDSHNTYLDWLNTDYWISAIYSAYRSKIN